jgi:hypothetical protein
MKNYIIGFVLICIGGYIFNAMTTITDVDRAYTDYEYFSRCYCDNNYGRGFADSTKGVELYQRIADNINKDKYKRENYTITLNKEKVLNEVYFTVNIDKGLNNESPVIPAGGGGSSDLFNDTIQTKIDWDSVRVLIEDHKGSPDLRDSPIYFYDMQYEKR